METISNHAYFSKLQQDNVYVNAEVKDLKTLTGFPTSSKYSRAIISEGEIVNVVSNEYGFLPNEKFFYEIEMKLIEADLQYVTRSVNRGNKHFAVDYILSDESYHINAKNGGDSLTPMLRFTNSYAGGPTSGNFGFYRQVCSNGLQIAQTKVGFKVRHKSSIGEIVLPEIKTLVAKFMDNEFYSLHKKFEVLAETPITDLNEFVKFTCTKLDLFKYEASEKNPETPSKNAQLVMDIINREANTLGTGANLWLGYNAFNQYLHGTGKSFSQQQNLDKDVFATVLEMAN